MTWKGLVTGLALLGVVGVGLGFFWFHHRPDTLHLSGVVEIQEVRLGSKIGGRVDRINTFEGEVAQPGQALVYFAEPELEAQRDQALGNLQAAEADLEKARNGPRAEEKQAAQQAMDAARAHWELLKAGSRPEEIREARSQLASAEADLTLCRQKYERTRQLYNGTGPATREEFESAKAALDSNQAKASQAKAHLDLLLAGNRAEDIEQGYRLYKQAQANYELLKIGTRPEDIAMADARVVQARARYSELQANLDEAIVRAPERVVVEVLAVRKGDLVPANQPVVRVLRADDLWVKVYVPETELGKVRLNQEVEVTIDSYPGRRFSGTIMQIASESEFTPRNIQSVDERRHQVFGIKVRVPNPEGVFKSGMAADVYVPLK
jgi:multidrug efflux pump subunit AcrA (membrane-fusion protein)